MSRDIQFIKRLRPLSREDTFVHLHWLFRQGPSALRGVVTAITLCGRKLPRARLTSHLDDTTCPQCQQIGAMHELPVPKEAQGAFLPKTKRK